jgi:hypothetical protein
VVSVARRVAWSRVRREVRHVCSGDRGLKDNSREIPRSRDRAPKSVQRLGLAGASLVVHVRSELGASFRVFLAHKKTRKEHAFLDVFLRAAKISKRRHFR